MQTGAARDQSTNLLIILGQDTEPPEFQIEGTQVEKEVLLVNEACCVRAFEFSSKEAINKNQCKLNKKHWKHLQFYTFDNFVKLQEAQGGFGADVYSCLCCLCHASAAY